MIALVETPTHCRADRFLVWAASLEQPHAPRMRATATGALRPLSRRRATRLARRSPLRLHIGCGTLYKDGWVNVDLAGTRVDLPWNLAEPLPFAPRSVDAIFHEHLLEHLTYSQGVELHRRCLALLKPGGVLRIGVPDGGAALQSYAMAPTADAGQWPTPMARVASLTYDSGHRSIYDAETLELSCMAAGFVKAECREFGEGDLQPNADSIERRGHTLYVEATA